MEGPKSTSVWQLVFRDYLLAGLERMREVHSGFHYILISPQNTSNLAQVFLSLFQILVGEKPV